MTEQPTPEQVREVLAERLEAASGALARARNPYSVKWTPPREHTALIDAVGTILEAVRELAAAALKEQNQ